MIILIFIQGLIIIYFDKILSAEEHIPNGNEHVEENKYLKEKDKPIVKPALPEIALQVPVVSDVDMKLAAFNNRHSPKVVKQLTIELFDTLKFNSELKYAFDLYKKERYQEALDAYRDYFVKRLQMPPPGFRMRSLDLKPDPKLAEEEMDNIISLWAAEADIDPMDPNIEEKWRRAVSQGKQVILKVNLGKPGAINYTFVPKGFVYMENYQSENWIHNETRKFPFTNHLLDQYAKTGDIKYLNKWSEYLDALHLQWCNAGIEAKLQINISVNELEWYTNVFWPKMIAVARARSEFRDQLSSYTLAKTLIHMWRIYVPVQMRLARYITGNRLSHMYTQKFLDIGLSFPEFVFSDYVLREKRRATEIYPLVSGFPDGGDVNIAYNYEFNWPDVAQGTVEALAAEKPSYMTPEWSTYLNDAIIRRYRKLAHDVHNDGTTPHWRKPGKDYEFKWRDIANQSGKRLMSPWLTDFPDNIRILNTIYGDGSYGGPNFYSEGFPYTGFYHLRSGWKKSDQDLFFCAYRPLEYKGESMALHLRLYAYGKEMISCRNGGKLEIDGLPKIESMTSNLYPANQLADWRTNRYGRMQVQMGADDVLPNRFHSGKFFDFSEASYSGAFAGNGHFYDGAKQTRQIFFLREEGIWIVTDRLETKGKHDYALTWEMRRNKEENGFDLKDIKIDSSNGIINTESDKGANLGLYMINPNPLNIVPMSADVSVDHLPSGWKGRYLSETSSIHFQFYFSGVDEQVWTTVLYPRKQESPSFKWFRPFIQNGVQGFDAMLPSGQQVSYRCAPEPTNLNINEVKAVASAMVLIKRAPHVVGFALDAESLITDHKVISPTSDFEFGEEIIPVYRPLGLVAIQPKEQDAFINSLEISLSHTDKNVEIRYTTNRSDPDLTSTIYSGPFSIFDTTMVKAIAVRKGVTCLLPVASSTHYSLPNSAIYYRMPHQWPSIQLKNSSEGLQSYFYHNDYTLTGTTFPYGEKIRNCATVRNLFDLSQAQEVSKSENVGFIFNGFIKIPQNGIYTFHAPEEFMHWGVDAGYDLRVFLDDKEWYPGTFRNNFRRWSIPLQSGFHALKVYYVDMRPSDSIKRYFFADENQIIEGKEMWRYRIWDGKAPQLEISGPSLSKRDIPAEWLYSGTPEVVKK